MTAAGIAARCRSASLSWVQLSASHDDSTRGWSWRWQPRSHGTNDTVTQVPGPKRCRHLRNVMICEWLHGLDVCWWFVDASGLGWKMNPLVVALAKCREHFMVKKSASSLGYMYAKLKYSLFYSFIVIKSFLSSPSKLVVFGFWKF